jgi:hypothetical protein
MLSLIDFLGSSELSVSEKREWLSYLNRTTKHIDCVKNFDINTVKEIFEKMTATWDRVDLLEMFIENGLFLNVSLDFKEVMCLLAHYIGNSSYYLKKVCIALQSPKVKLMGKLNLNDVLKFWTIKDPSKIKQVLVQFLSSHLVFEEDIKLASSGKIESSVLPLSSGSASAVGVTSTSEKLVSETSYTPTKDILKKPGETIYGAHFDGDDLFLTQVAYH